MYVKIKTTNDTFLYVNGDSVSYIEGDGWTSDRPFTRITLRGGEVVLTLVPVREVVRLFNDGVYAEE